jgi:site-specific DNA recombinase
MRADRNIKRCWRCGEGCIPNPPGENLSRLTRDAVDSERVIRRLEFSGVRIVATSDGCDSTSKARKVHRGFKGLMNEIILDDLRERVHRGLAGQVIQQYWAGGRPHGYRLKPVLHPTEFDQYGQPARIGTELESTRSRRALCAGCSSASLREPVAERSPLS